MSRKRIALIHFYPLEYFPPITNLLDYFSTSFPEIKLSVCSTNNNKNRKVYHRKGIKIYRFPFPKPNEFSILRALKYSLFFLFSLIQLILKKPDAVIYYETISSWPVYVYSKYINKKCDVIVHFHEYASLSWYSRHMKLVRYFHKLEKSYLFKKAAWISQTNEFRLSLFHKDYPELDPEKLIVLPNYPPKKWNLGNSSESKISPYLKIVYIGSLSFEGTLIREFCNWIISQKEISFDIFSYNLHDDVKSFLNELSGSNINFYDEGVDYQEIPKLLKEYDVGVILHRVYNENYKFNATNKLFEYLICDLDVWFPNEMIGCHEYVTQGTWPVVVGLDFENLNAFDPMNYIVRKDLSYKPQHFYCEDAYQKLSNFLLNK